MKYEAGCPVPSLTVVNASVAALPVTLAILRSITVPGVATAGVTVTAALPVIPPLVALIVAVPAATPVANPLPVTPATVASLDVHTTACPVSTLPAESSRVAVSCEVPPAAMLVADGLTTTAATDPVVGGGGVARGPVATVRLSTHRY